ncbi:MAG: DUF928 domain-containing protein [Brasilonema angustatum HA4187-MV1]|jgi:hypothetical protein|nr:DUF928 domain-containing protein [Brasilonema angustatum HA4187-MV1]
MHQYVSTAQKVTFACILSLILAHSLQSLPSAQAQQSQRSPNLTEKIKRFFFGTRPGGVVKGIQRGGAVRGRCSNLDQQIIALVPSTENKIPFVEQTISEHPTFWFYIPDLSVSRLNAEFVLIDSQDKEVYSATFALKQQPGIINLQLPKIVPALKEGKEYRWVFSAICNPQNRAADAIVNGRLERIPVSSALNTQLKAAPPKERVSLYTDAKLWYETLTALAELQRSNPQDTEVKTDWANVLQLMGLPKNAPQTWTTYPLPNRTENNSRN